MNDGILKSGLCLTLMWVRVVPGTQQFQGFNDSGVEAVGKRERICLLLLSVLTGFS